MAQTFTAGLSGTLAGVNVSVGFHNSEFSLRVAIRSVSDGRPTTTILGERTLNCNEAPLSLLITFPQQIDIVAGAKYAIVVDYEDAPPPGAGQTQGNWHGSCDDAYTRGEPYATVAGTSWAEGGGRCDMHFQTYVVVN